MTSDPKISGNAGSEKGTWQLQDLLSIESLELNPETTSGLGFPPQEDSRMKPRVDWCL
ncbi:MAG TPA: hypothetical protein VGL91_15460 [Acidobacteriota bacterium]|jgi:hypothetical protein